MHIVYHQRRRPKAEAKEASRVPSSTVVEASPVGAIGCWILPSKDEGFAYLPIHKSYGRGDVDMSKPGDPFMAGYNSLVDHYPWLENAMKQSIKDAGRNFYNTPAGMDRARAVFTLYALKHGCVLGDGVNGRLVIMDVDRPPDFVGVIVGAVNDGHLAAYGLGGDSLPVVDIRGRKYIQRPRYQRVNRADTAGLLSAAAAVKNGNMAQLPKLTSTWKAFNTYADPMVKAYVSRTLDAKAQRAIAALDYLLQVREGSQQPTKKKMQAILPAIEAWGGMELVQWVYEEFSEFQSWLLGEDSPYELTDKRILTEVTFRRLLDLTGRNGQYRRGGLVNIGGRWVTDPSVPGRRQNARFVITRPPRVERDEDGLLTIRFRFQSRRERNTSGMAAVGYIKFIPPANAFQKLWRVVRGVFRPHQFDQDVQCYCNCADFKYRFQYVLARMGAAPRGDVDAPPLQTNPRQLPSLCKHLTAASQFLSMSDKQFKELDDLTQTQTFPTGVDKPRGVRQGAQTTEIPDDEEPEKA